MQRPTGSSHLAFGMAALVAAGGTTGFAKTGSVPSLVAGLGIAALFGAGGQQINVSRAFSFPQLSGSKLGLPDSPARPFLPPCPRRLLRAERAARHWAPCEPSSISGTCRRHGPSIHKNPEGGLLKAAAVLLQHGWTRPSARHCKQMPPVLLPSAAGVASGHYGSGGLAEHCIPRTEESGVAGVTAAARGTLGPVFSHSVWGVVDSVLL